MLILPLGCFADPTRIVRGPEDQVVKRGSMPRLHCRVKHDPTLKLTVTWLKDDAPLYIGNRSVMSTSICLLTRIFIPPLQSVSGGTRDNKDKH